MKILVLESRAVVGSRRCPVWRLRARRGCPPCRHVHGHLRSGKGGGDARDGFPEGSCRSRVLVLSTSTQFVHLRRCCLRNHRILPIHPPSAIETLHDFHALLRVATTARSRGNVDHPPLDPHGVVIEHRGLVREGADTSHLQAGTNLAPRRCGTSTARWRSSRPCWTAAPVAGGATFTGRSDCLSTRSCARRCVRQWTRAQPRWTAVPLRRGLGPAP